ncbi:polysaccharide lyase family 8 super-sandwich domain-containing protein [Niabella aquatica]
MKQLRLLLLLVCTTYFPAKAQTHFIQQLKHNIVTQLLHSEKDFRLSAIQRESYVADQVVADLMSKKFEDQKTIDIILSRYQPDGSFSDIDYESQNRSGWPSRLHVDRLQDLARNYKKKGGPYYMSSKILAIIHQSLQFWIDKKPVSSNWWYNQIGIPKALGETALLLEAELTQSEKAAVLSILQNARFGMTGQNKVWLAGNVFMRALLQDSALLAMKARDTIASEIRTDREEGIKPDQSFHQHGPQQQFGNYGMAFVTSMGFWGNVFANTQAAFDQNQLNILYQLLYEGYGRILWKGFLDVNALGRQFFNNAQLHKGLAAGQAIKNLADIDSLHQKNYFGLLANNFSQQPSVNTLLNGNYHFWLSDLTIHRTPNWMASVKMSSPRVQGAEALNGDNLKGYYLADGATYVYVTGKEYENIFPIWDWRKLPGITAAYSNAPIPALSYNGYRNKNAFVGNVNNGNSGMTAMDFERDSLIAKKLWIYTNSMMVCIGAGIHSNTPLPVYTTLEQKLSKGSYQVKKGNTLQPISDTLLHLLQTDRIYHEKTGYINLGNAATGFYVQQQKRKSSWSSIMSIYPENFMHEGNVFTLWLDHGIKPENEKYAYVVLPDVAAEEFLKWRTGNVQILENTNEIQAVFLPETQTYYIALYHSGALVTAEGFSFSSRIPGLYQVKKNKKNFEVYVSDPARKYASISFSINNKKYSVSLPQGFNSGTPVRIL